MSKRSTRYQRAVCLSCGTRSDTGERKHTRERGYRGLGSFGLDLFPGFGKSDGKVTCHGPWAPAPKGKLK